MKVLVIGGGGREHALAWKAAQSERVERITFGRVEPSSASEGSRSTSPASTATLANERTQPCVTPTPSAAWST